LSPGARAARAREIFWPYHQRIEANSASWTDQYLATIGIGPLNS
jgi:predicted N-formylglutamate amidohydrolase